jgi:hypothetical protein
MSDNPQGAIDALIARAESDSALRDRLIADPKATILAETGMTVPAEWALMAREEDGSIVLGFVNDELPEDYLEVVSGGADPAYDSCPGFDRSRN